MVREFSIVVTLLNKWGGPCRVLFSMRAEVDIQFQSALVFLTPLPSGASSIPVTTA
jgi:hypothetical protein